MATQKPNSPAQPIKVINVRRGRRPSYTRPHSPWLAHYVFEFTSEPSAAWKEIFDSMALSTFGWLDHDAENRTVAFHANPDQLQFVLERLNEMCAETDLYLADMVAHPERLAEFEKEADRAIERLAYPVGNDA